MSMYTSAAAAANGTAVSTGFLEQFFVGYWKQHGDPRVEPLFFMGSFRPAATILAIWTAFVLYFGPRWMERRKAFSLKIILPLYNFSMSLSSCYFLVRYFGLYRCGADMFQIRFPSFEVNDERIASIIALNHIYVFSKFVDLLDTVFFVLRKKQSQITGLHFYHHLTVPLISWTYFRLCGNNAYIIPFQLMNNFVHTIMYGYYGLTALGPAVQPYLWWKRYITQVQIVQFVLLFSYGVYFSAFQQGYHFFYSFNILTQSPLYMWLFGRFYLRAYQQKKRTAAAAVNEAANGKLSNGKLTNGQEKIKNN